VADVRERGESVAWAAYFLGMLVLLTAPRWGSAYLVGFCVELLSYMALVTAWTMFSGPTRYFSLATAAFFGIGTYVTVYLGGRIPVLACVAVAAALAYLVASMVGLATLRLSGLYFVMFTFGLSEFLRQFVLWFEGRLFRKVGRIVSVPFSDLDLYYALWGITAVLLLSAFLLRRSRLGYALRAIGEDELAAAHAGVNVSRVKIGVFAATASAMAVVGAILAPRWAYVLPDMAFDPTRSFQVVLMAMLGGIRHSYGPLLGTIPLLLLYEWLYARYPYPFMFVLGLLLAVLVLYAPGGVSGMMEGILQRAEERRQEAMRIRAEELGHVESGEG
jgi:branched-chain amino acid transport system permease protein